MNKELLQQALDALILSQAYIGEDCMVPGWGDQLDMNDASIDALREAIAQPVKPAISKEQS